MTWLYVTLGVLSVYLLLGFISVIPIHKKYFSKRYKKNPLINYYTKEEFNLKNDEIEFDCNGLILRGDFYYYDNPRTDKLIIVCHGMFSSVISYMQEIEYFCRKGFKVLAFDYEGTEKSEGKGIRGLSNSPKCISAGIDYVKSLEEFKGVEICLFGHSWGAFGVTNAIKYHKDVNKVCAVAPFASLKRLCMGMYPKFMWLFIPLFIFIEIINCGKYAFLKGYNTLNSFNNEVLILHSEDDSIVNYSYNTKYLQDKLSHKQNISFMILQGKNHNPTYTYKAIELSKEYNKLYYSLPKDEVDELTKNTDFHALGELDPEVMDKIVEFYNK